MSPLNLSVLDLVPVRTDQSTGDALAATLALGLILSVPIYLHRRAQGDDLQITDPEDIPPHELP